MRDTAAELLHLYAMREAKQGFAFETESSDYQAFCEGFAFEETPDQAAAIAAVINDMHSGRPMDRLVCGDVGFGKTEVALRAAFIAVMNGQTGRDPLSDDASCRTARPDLQGPLCSLARESR